MEMMNTKQKLALPALVVYQVIITQIIKGQSRTRNILNQVMIFAMRITMIFAMRINNKYFLHTAQKKIFFQNTVAGWVAFS